MITRYIRVLSCLLSDNTPFGDGKDVAERLRSTADRRRLCAASEDDATGDDGGDGCAAQRPAVERGIAALGLGTRGVERPCEVGVEDGHVCMRAGAERAAVCETEDARRRSGAEFDEPFERDVPAMHEPSKGERDGRLKPRDAVGRLVVFERLLVCVVRRVVCGDGVNRAVADGIEDRCQVLCAAQRRAHLRVRVVAFDRRVRQGEVMRRDLAGDR